MTDAAASITVTAVLVADLLAEGERMPVSVHVIDHPDGRVLVDTGMTELIRPALYGAIHPIVALTSLGAPVDGTIVADVDPTAVHGPICESTDALGEHELPPLQRGDLVAIRDAGAYAASLSSTPSGKRRRVRARPARWGTIAGATLA